MLKTNRWYRFVAVAEDNAPKCSPEAAHRLATAPFPTVNVFTPARSTHAMGFRRSTHDFDASADYATTKGDR